MTDLAPPRDSAELTCLAALRGGRARFFSALADHAAIHAPEPRRVAGGILARDYLALLRSDETAQIAEFFFVVEELGLSDGALFRAYLQRHNAAMEAYLADVDRMRSFGLTPQRVRAARFTDDQMDFVEFMSPPGQLLLDQTSIGRLMVEIMPPDTCRKVLSALTDGGLLKRHVVGQTLIGSEGLLEQLFRAHLTEVVQATRGQA